MKEKTNEENKVYLVSIRLSELVFVTEAKDEKEAKTIIYKHIINNKHTYPDLVAAAMAIENFLDNILVVPLTFIERFAKDLFDDTDCVRNVARTIWVMGK